MSTIEDSLNNVGLELGSHRYTFTPFLIPQWQESDKTEVTIELNTFTETNRNELCIYFSEGESQVNVFQTTFLGDEVFNTFVAEALASRHFHTVELEFDDMDMVYFTDSYEDTVSCLTILLGFLGDARPVSQEALSPISPPPNEDTLARFISNLNANSITADQEDDVIDLLRHQMTFEGFDILILLIQAAKENKSELPKDTVQAVSNATENFLQDILDTATDEYELEDNEASALKDYLHNLHVEEGLEEAILEKACADNKVDLYENLVDLAENM